MIHIPLWFMLILSNGILGIAKITGTEPLVTPPLVKKFASDWNVSSSKAIKELGYSPVNLNSGLKKTLEWINSL